MRWHTSTRRSARIPTAYPHSPLDDEAAFTRWFELPMDQLIDEVIAKRGGSRAVATMTFVADRRLEVLAHGFERHPIGRV